MVKNTKPELLIEIDLDSTNFQSKWNKLDYEDQKKAVNTFSKITQLTWSQLYKDSGLKWEKIISAKPPTGIDTLYSFRITKSIRGLGYRDKNILRILIIHTEHDAAYGKK